MPRPEGIRVSSGRIVESKLDSFREEDGPGFSGRLTKRKFTGWKTRMSPGRDGSPCHSDWMTRGRPAVPQAVEGRDPWMPFGGQGGCSAGACDGRARGVPGGSAAETGDRSCAQRSRQTTAVASRGIRSRSSTWCRSKNESISRVNSTSTVEARIQELANTRPVHPARSRSCV